MPNKLSYKVSDCDTDILSFISYNGGFDPNSEEALLGLDFYEFTLEELGLPGSDVLLKSILDIEKIVGLQGWSEKGQESETYKGFSLTYNPDFIFSNQSIFHQTMGSPLLTQSFSRKINHGNHSVTKNTYYDSYGFRKIHPIIFSKLGYFLDKFSMPIIRSRVAYQYGFNRGVDKKENWHIDEPPYEVLRINIPLQTSHEHVLDIVGSDGKGNYLKIINKHLECGKLYIWNTRIPHRLTFKEICLSKSPRIHLVLGLCPWFDYNKDTDSFVKNQFFGQPIKKIVDSKLFIL
jgi:hypothetical protein